MNRSLAVASLGLALLSLWLFFISGIPAVILGWIAIRRIRRSDFEKKGLRIAQSAMVLGSFMCLMTIPAIHHVNKKLVRDKAAVEARNRVLQEKP